MTEESKDAPFEPEKSSVRSPDFRTYLLGGPKVDSFEIERDSDTGRPVELETSDDE